MGICVELNVQSGHCSAHHLTNWGRFEFTLSADTAFAIVSSSHIVYLSVRETDTKSAQIRSQDDDATDRCHSVS